MASAPEYDPRKAVTITVKLKKFRRFKLRYGLSMIFFKLFCWICPFKIVIEKEKTDDVSRHNSRDES